VEGPLKLSLDTMTASSQMILRPEFSGFDGDGTPVELGLASAAHRLRVRRLDEMSPPPPRLGW
jgi:hypothetical protein